MSLYSDALGRHYVFIGFVSMPGRVVDTFKAWAGERLPEGWSLSKPNHQG